MPNEQPPAAQPSITREKLLQYRAGGLTAAEKEEIRRALASDPRLAACCQEEECLDKCIERCCKQDQASGDLKARIRACIAESAAAAATATAAAKVLSLPPQPIASTPVPAGRGLGRFSLVAAAALLLVVGGAWLATAQTPSRLAQVTPTAPSAPGHHHPPHQTNNPLDSLVHGYEASPAANLPSESTVISMVHKVGLQRPPHGPLVERLLSVDDVACDCGGNEQGVKVSFQCSGHQNWNLSVLCVSPALLVALHQHDSVQSATTQRVYYMCGDVTGQHPCGVFWVEDGKIMVLVAQQPPKSLIAMADGLEF